MEVHVFLVEIHLNESLATLSREGASADMFPFLLEMQALSPELVVELHERGVDFEGLLEGLGGKQTVLHDAAEGRVVVQV